MLFVVLLAVGILEANLLHESWLYGERPLSQVYFHPLDSYRGGPAFGRSFPTHSMKTFRSLMEAPDGIVEEHRQDGRDHPKPLRPRCFSGQPLRATLMPICHLDIDVLRDGGILEESLFHESRPKLLRPHEATDLHDLDALDLHAGFLHESRLYDEKRLDEDFRMRGRPSPAESHRGGLAFGRLYLTHSMKTFRFLM